MVTIQVNNLIDFVAEVFSHSESSPEEARRIATYLTTANLTGHDSHGVIRVPVYVRWKKTGYGRSQPDRRDRRRYAVARRGRRQVRLRPDRDAAGGADRHREVQEGGAGRGRAAQRRAYRPRRRLGRNGRRRRAGVGPFRQRRRLAAGGAVTAASRSGCRPRPIASAFRAQGQDPIVLDFATSIVAEGKVLVASRGGKKLPTGALVDADGTLSEDPSVLYGPYSAGRAARPHQGHRRDPRLRRAQGLGAGLHLRTARRRADRHRRDFGRTGASPTACSRSMSIPR